LKKRAVIIILSVLAVAAIAYAASFTSYNDITDIADGDHFLIWDASEGSGDELANISYANLKTDMFASPTFTGTVTIPDNEVDSADINTIVDTIVWNAAGISSDGTNCADPVEVTLNSGPKQYTISCADNAASIIYGHVAMPDSYDGGTVVFKIIVFHGTTETITFAGDFSAQCRADAETVSSTWGTAQSADVAITTANLIEMQSTSAVQPANSCAAGDMMWWRWVMDAATSDANAANTDILGVTMEYTSNVGD
jgi:hypothetical protein